MRENTKQKSVNMLIGKVHGAALKRNYHENFTSIKSSDPPAKP